MKGMGWRAGMAMVAIALAAPASANPAATGPQARDAWVRLPAVSGRPAAGFFMLKGGAAADALVAASSPKAERVEMHSMSMADGVMRMRAEKSFALPKGATVPFQPGGNHLMLFGISPDVKPGDTVPVVLRFQSGAELRLDAEARAPGTSAPAAKPAGHQH